jgi:hypothetical protein
MGLCRQSSVESKLAKVRVGKWDGFRSMPRDRSKKLVVSMPAKYEPDFERRLDKRTVVGAALLQRLNTIASELGGADSLSHIKMSLVKRAIWLEAVVESHEQNLANHQEIDLGAYVQALNGLVGLYRTLGIERRQRPVRALREVMASQ